MYKLRQESIIFPKNLYVFYLFFLVIDQIQVRNNGEVKRKEYKDFIYLFFLTNKSLKTLAGINLLYCITPKQFLVQPISFRSHPRY